MQCRNRSIYRLLTAIDTDLDVTFVAFVTTRGFNDLSVVRPIYVQFSTVPLPNHLVFVRYITHPIKTLAIIDDIIPEKKKDTIKIAVVTTSLSLMFISFAN